MYKSKSKKGFTLVELIVVLAIIAILSAVMIPAIASYVSKEKKRKDDAEATALTIMIQGFFDKDLILEKGYGFDLDDVVSFLIEKKYSLKTESSRRYIFDYRLNKVVSTDPKNVSKYTGEEEVLFPNEWQVNSMTIIKEYGYFVTFDKVEYKEKADSEVSYGYDITYVTGEYIKYIDGHAEAGIYTADKNKPLKTWEELGKEGLVSGGLSSNPNDKISNSLNIKDKYPQATRLIYPNTLNRIAGTLQNQPQLEYVFLPDEITEMTNGMNGDTKLKYIRLPSSDTCKYGDGFNFNGTTSMTYVHLPPKMNFIGNSAFANSGIKNIIIPKGIKSLSNQPFIGAKSLECLAFSKSFERIDGNDVFQGCTNLRSIFLPKSIKSCSETAFNHGTGNNYIPNVTDIYFEGNARRYLGEEDANGLERALRNNLEVKDENGKQKLKIHCYDETDPKEEAYLRNLDMNLAYWHYEGFAMDKWEFESTKK